MAPFGTASWTARSPFSILWKFIGSLVWKVFHNWISCRGCRQPPLNCATDDDLAGNIGIFLAGTFFSFFFLLLFFIFISSFSFQLIKVKIQDIWTCLSNFISYCDIQLSYSSTYRVEENIYVSDIHNYKHTWIMSMVFKVMNMWFS